MIRRASRAPVSRWTRSRPTVVSRSRIVTEPAARATRFQVATSDRLAAALEAPRSDDGADGDLPGATDPDLDRNAARGDQRLRGQLRRELHDQGVGTGRDRCCRDPGGQRAATAAWVGMPPRRRLRSRGEWRSGRARSACFPSRRDRPRWRGCRRPSRRRRPPTPTARWRPARAMRLARRRPRAAGSPRRRGTRAPIQSLDREDGDLADRLRAAAVRLVAERGQVPVGRNVDAFEVQSRRPTCRATG